MAPATEFQVIEGRPGAAAAPEAPAHEPAPAGEGTELMLMALSSGIAFAGIGLARRKFWLANRAAAANIARSAGGHLHAAAEQVLHRRAVRRRRRPADQALSTTVLWKGADAALIDGSVNGVGKAVQGTSSVLRRLQSGSIRAYAASLFLGVVLILGWYLFR